MNIVPDANRNILGITFDTASAGAFVVGTTGGNALLLSNGGTIQTTSSVANVETVNAPLVLEGNVYTIASNASSSTATLNIGGAITGAASGTTVLTLTGTNSGANTVGGIISDGPSNPIQVVKSGSGNWTLAADNTFSGGLSVIGGTLRVGNSNAIPSASLLTVKGTGTLDLNGFNVNLAGGLSDGGPISGASTGTILSNNGPATLTLVDDNQSYGGAIADGTGGSVRVVANAGTGSSMVLSGTNSYSGGTTVNAELEAWSSGALGSGAVAVNDGGTLALKGNSDGINYGQNLTLGSGSGGIAALVLNTDAALRTANWAARSP